MSKKKVISIMVPTYNEEENVIPLYEEIVKTLKRDCSGYDYEILFIDNKSKDRTREYIRQICARDSKVRAIFNAKNFGQFNSPFYGLISTTGDCTISICADFQDPVDMIPKFIHEWEKGYKIVCGIKTSSKENKIMYFLRSCYYKTIKKMSSVEMIEHFTGFGLYDRSFIQFLRQLKDPAPFIRGIVAEYGYERKDIEYTQAKRRSGKTSNNWYSLFDAAMLSVTSFTKIGLRIATIMGMCCSFVSIIIALIYLVMKLFNWYDFQAGMAPILIGVFFLGSIQIFFIGLIGEYIMGINARTMNRPLVLEEERINFKPEHRSKKLSMDQLEYGWEYFGKEEADDGGALEGTEQSEAMEEE